MRLLTGGFLVFILSVWSLVAHAQTDGSEDDDRGFLTSLIEDNLSGAGREVRIEGFEGALSSRATIAELTIADDEGVWITLRDIVLDWNRSALLRGRLQVTELSASELLLPRLPAGDPAPPSPEAREFSIPELPVSVEIGQLAIDRAELGAPVVGTELAATLNGSASLAGGSADIDLVVERLDGPTGRFAVDVAYQNDSSQLDLALAVEEDAGGLVASQIGLPGEPSIALTVDGSAPLDEFVADINLQTNGEPRLAGQVALSATPSAEPVEGEPAPPPIRGFDVDLGGDVTALFAPQYRDFFGEDIRLDAVGRRFPDGRVELDDFTLAAQALRLSGQVTIGADGLPTFFDIDGRMATDDGTPVLLPIGGPETRVSSVDLRADYSAEAGETWDLEATLEDLQRPDLSLASVDIEGGGRITREPNRGVTADIVAALSGFRHQDEDLSTALGEALTIDTSLVWEDGAPLDIGRLDLVSGDLRATASGIVNGLGDGYEIDGQATLDIGDLSRFSGVAGRDLAGRAEARIVGSGAPLGGAFDIDLAAEGEDLAFGIDQIDALIGGQSTLALVAARTTEGTEVDRFALDSEALDITAEGTLDGQTGDLRFSATLDDVARVVEGVSGPAEVNGRAIRTGDTWDLDLDASAPGEAVVAATGRVDTSSDALPAEGEVEVTIGQLSAYAAAAGQPLSGAVTATFTGSGALSEQTLDGRLDVTAESLATGIEVVDALIPGTTTLSAAAERTTGQTEFEFIRLSSPAVSFEASGVLSDTGASSLRFDASLDNLARIVPDLPGAVTASGTASKTGAFWDVDIDATGPAGTVVAADGTVKERFDELDLDLDGAVPLALANTVTDAANVQGLANFDLNLSGAPSLSALSGRVTTSGARVSIPRIEQALTDIEATVDIAQGTASISATGSVPAGGGLSVNGTLGLQPPLPADLAVTLSDLAVVDPQLYETTVNGTLSVDGPLTAGGQITGTLDLGVTEIQVPSGGGGAGGSIPDITHVGAPADVQRTRRAAGFAEEDDDGGGGGGGSGAGAGGLGLNVLVRAPNQIFIRGRGLDAELGGRLRLTGTTSDIVPIGQFSLVRGRLDILGKRIVLEEGLVRLQGDFTPFIRLVAGTDAGDVTVRIIIEGPANEPELTFESDPDLPEDEVLARLLFGRGIDSISALQAAQLASAVATLSGRGGNGIVGNLRENFGLDDLDITTDEEGNAAVRAGRYLSENIYTDVTVGAEGEAEINLNLDVTDSVTAKGRLGSDGDTGVGIFFERDY